MVVLKLKVSSIVTHRDDWKAVKATVVENSGSYRNLAGQVIENDELLNCTGYKIPEVGQEFIAEGKFIKNTKYIQDTFEIKKVSNIEGDIDPVPFLTSIKGVGKKSADRIVNHFGKGCLEILAKTPERLEELKLVRLIDVFETIFSEKITLDQVKILAGYGLTSAHIAYIIRKSKKNAFEEFKQNPYMYFVYDFLGFKDLDRLAKIFGLSPNDPNRLETAVHHIMHALSSNGDTYSDYNSLATTYKRLLRISDDSYLLSSLKNLQELNKVWIRENINTKELYIGIDDLYKKELFIAQMLRLKVQRRTYVPTANAIRQIEIESGFTLADYQKEAIDKAVNNGVSIVTGGPGTGKTFTLTSIIKALENMNSSTKIILIAPTGKAAKRMSEQTKREAHTIHSYLKMRPGQMTSDVYIDADVVIADESSMLDVNLAAALFGALSEHTSIIFVGDIDQLPSIGPGNILNDMIASDVIPVTRLQAVYRQAEDSRINRNANKILAGDNDLLYGPDFELIETSDPDSASKIIVEEMSKNYNNFGAAECCVLTPLRQNKLTSVNYLNPILQKRLNTHEGVAEITVQDKIFKVGDKVMITKNSIQASNGDVGLIVAIDSVLREVTVDLGYPNLTVLHDEELDTLDLGYAMSIHKSQGSEYDCVIISIMDEHDAMLQKNLIYTAITRAKKKVIMVGQKDAINKSIKGVLPPRKTLLEDMLRTPDKELI